MDELFMGLAIEEAKKGLGKTSPNPCVGAIIVKEGRVIGKGYHRRAGGAHAEINAIDSARETLRGATIYVTLEPCSHTGKTGPCCEALVRAGFARVVIGMTDPNPLVNGRGCKYLLDHGLDVVSGVSEAKCEALNYPFIKSVTKKLPWMIMKAGVSLDGRLNYQRQESGWLTGKETARRVHMLRDSVDAIMVGCNTVKIDNPMLTTRLEGIKTKDPTRIIVDSKLSTPLSAKVYRSDSKAAPWVLCLKTAAEERILRFRDAGVRVVTVAQSQRGINLADGLAQLAAAGICSILVEGGAALHGTLLAEGLYDYAHLFFAPLFAGDAGVPLINGVGFANRQAAPRIDCPEVKRLGEDTMVSGRIIYPS